MGPILFSIYINDLGKDIQAKKHFYADDTIIYTLAPCITLAVKELQIAFQSLEDALVSLKLVLNSQNTKVIFFFKSSGTST